MAFSLSLAPVPFDELLLEALGAQCGPCEGRERCPGDQGTDPRLAFPSPPSVLRRCPAPQRWWRGCAECLSDLSLIRCPPVAPEALETRRPRIDPVVSAFFWDTDPEEMVLNAQLPEWGPCAGGKSGEGRGGPIC